MKNSTWFLSAIIGTVGILCLFGAFIYGVDPFFHYHPPIEGMAYTLGDTRYQNDGILRHFQYDTIMSGTSMSANFSTTQCDDIFGASSVKVPFYGASLKEINDCIKRGLIRRTGIKTVIRSLDRDRISRDRDFMQYDDMPYYLYDDNPFNDVEYLLNKEAFIMSARVLLDTRDGKTMTSFDDYQSWNDLYDFGKDVVLSTYERPGVADKEVELSEEEAVMIRDNIRANAVETALQYPEVTFYMFNPPYSICYWDTEVIRPQRLNWWIDVQRIVMEELTAVPNIRYYCFDDRTDIISDLDNYKDIQHYGKEVNSMMLRWMKDGEGLITRDNYEAYLKKIRDIYSDYDYDSIYEE